MSKLGVNRVSTSRIAPHRSHKKIKNKTFIHSLKFRLLHVKLNGGTEVELYQYGGPK